MNDPNAPLVEEWPDVSAEALDAADEASFAPDTLTPTAPAPEEES